MAQRFKKSIQLKAEPNWRIFERLFNRAFIGQQELFADENEENG
jgi:hypothetical protein